MIKEKRRSDVLVFSRQSKVKTQMVSLSLASTKKTNSSNSKSNSLRQKNIDVKFKTTKCSPEKSGQQNEREKNKPKNNSKSNNHENIEKNANEFLKKKITKFKHNDTKTKSNCLNFTNPFHPRNNITNIIISNQKTNSITKPKNSSIHNNATNTSKTKTTSKNRFASPYNANINLLTKSHKSSNSNSNSKNFFQIKKQIISQTTPVTNQNSRKTSAEKKIIPSSGGLGKDIKYLIQTKKKSALGNVTHQQHNSQKSSVINNTHKPVNILSFSANIKTHLTTANSPTHMMTFNKNMNNQSAKPANAKSAVTKSKSNSKKKTETISHNSHNNRLGIEKEKENNTVTSMTTLHHKSEHKSKNTQSATGNHHSHTINNCTGNKLKYNNTNINIKSISMTKSTSHSVTKKPKAKTSNHLKASNKGSKSGNIKKSSIKSNPGNAIPISRKSKSNSKTKTTKNEKSKIIQRNRSNANKTDSLTYNASVSTFKSVMIKEGTYYSLESEKLSQYITKFYEKNKEYPKTKLSFYKFGRLIGRGAFGKVNIGLHVLTGKIVAIKSFNKKKLHTESPKSKIYHEVNLMKNLRHSSIVKILETLETEKYIFIIMEHIAGGDLLSFIKKRTKLTEKTSKIIFKQLIKSIKYLHMHNIVHRDIKLDNILIDLNSSIKLCDFGISRRIKKGELLKDQCGTPAYIAPEILSNEPYEGYPVDLWSSGVVLYAMLTGLLPFKANCLRELHELIIKGQYPEMVGVSEDVKNLVRGLLEVNPKKRLTADAVLEHPWLISSDETKGSLFTKAEIVLLSKANVDYRTCNKEDIIENFTLKNLDTKNDNENKNIKTKSAILAPFNTTYKESSNEVCELQFENSVILFNTQTKVLNRLYELNNNNDFDHGIIINHKSKSNDSKGENNEIDTRTISLNHSPVENKMASEGELSSKKDSQRNINSSLTNSSTFIIDDSVLKTLEHYGYAKDYIQKCLTNNELNYATACYYLESKYNNMNDSSTS